MEEGNKAQLHASILHGIPNLGIETAGPAFNRSFNTAFFDNVFQRFKTYDQQQQQQQQQDQQTVSHQSSPMVSTPQTPIFTPYNIKQEPPTTSPALHIVPMSLAQVPSTPVKITSKVKKTFTCDLCQDYRTYHKNGLDYHMKKYHGKALRLRCPYCAYSCIEKPHLDQHIRKHTGEKPYRCDFCDFRSASQSGLRYHKRTKHEQTALLPCHVCGYKAYNSYILTQHLRKHSGQKPFECKGCAMSFSCKASLSYHMKTKHSTSQHVPSS